jgi:hypothetical protein
MRNQVEKEKTNFSMESKLENKREEENKGVCDCKGDDAE